MTDTNNLQATGYDAVTDTKRRRKIVVNLKNEDFVLRPYDRDRATSEARNLRRNSSIVAWAVRTHLDNCAYFTFQCRTGIAELDIEIESLMAWWSRPFNCDVQGRHSFDRIIRLCEGLAITEGDVFVLKLADGRIQVIEGDRVRTPMSIGKNLPQDTDLKEFVHGIRCTEEGPQEYAICERIGGQTGGLNFVGGSGAFELKELVFAGHVLQHGYFDRYDQTRGIGPLTAAVNTWRDLYEAQEAALAKMKASSFFAATMKRSGDVDPASSNPEGVAGGDIKIDLAAGPQFVDLNTDEDFEFVESHNPSTEFQSFFDASIQSGLKGLDIPESFYDEAKTTYSGSRLALTHYENSAEDKRNNIRQRLLIPLTIWRLQLWILDGTLVLPDGMGIEDLNFEWIGSSLPAIDPSKEASAKSTMLGLGLTSHQRLCKEEGYDWYTIADELAKEQAHAKEIGLELGDSQPADNTEAVAQAVKDAMDPQQQ